MDKLKSLQEIYDANRPENNELFRAIQAHLQLKYPNKRMTATKTLQIIVADSVASGELRNVEARMLHSS